MDNENPIDIYINNFPTVVQEFLQLMRSTVKEAAPEATELLSYGMPAFKTTRLLIWFGGHTRHLGFYPGASAVRTFQLKLTLYVTSKGAIQFPYTTPLPVELIKEIVLFRVKENLAKSARK